ncbi:MAG: hypothetical protein LIQ31_04255, partial [Planctomycetes bacterium]|nr:hypothetical protein [Planctomycetota bacterium]
AADSASPVGIYDIDGVAVITGTDPANYSITYRGDGALVVTAAASNSGMDIEVLTPSTPSAPPTQSLTEIIAPPTDAAAFADVVALSNRPGLGPITVTEALASGRRLNDTQARLFSRFIVTRELWDSVVTPTGENGAIAESGITLEAVREHFLPALGTVTPDDWDFQAEYLPEDDTSDGDDGSPRRVRVTLTPR